MKRMSYLSIYFLIFLFGCTNYESEKYILYENEVITEIIPDLLSLEHYQIPNIENCSIFLIDELDNEIHKSIPEDTRLSVSREISPESIEERELFKPFINRRIKSRKLNTRINCNNLNLTLINLDDFQNRKRTEKPDTNMNDSISEIYLILTRIAFNKTKEKGYLNYTVYCGEACFWTNNIEIKMVNGKWIISKLFSGSIA